MSEDEGPKGPGQDQPHESGSESKAQQSRQIARHLSAFMRGMFEVGWSFIDVSKRRLDIVQEMTSPLPAETPTTEPEVPRPKETGREKDRDLDPASSIARERRERWGVLFVLVAFAVAIAGGFGFLFIYWTGGNNLLLGATLGGALGGFGVALVLWAHWLVRHREATEPREQLLSGEKERDAALDVFREGEHDVHRRTLLAWLSAATVGLFAASAVSLLRSVGSNPNAALYTTVWKRGQRLMTIDGKPITVDSLDVRSTITVFPDDSIGSEKSQTVLVRVEPSQLRLPSDRRNWAPMGYLAFSRICTHAGCPVGLYESENCQLMCPCHQSTFDVLRGAQPTGGPAARPLPQLPLYADGDGTLRAAGGFSSPPGPGFWGMPS